MSLASACRQRVKGIRTSVRKGGGGDKPLPLGRAVGLHQDRRVVLGVAAGCSRREGGLFRQPGLSPGWQYATSEGTDSIQEGGERRHGPAAAGERGEGEWRAGWSARLAQPGARRGACRTGSLRSEERRVGKECRSRWSP